MKDNRLPEVVLFGQPFRAQRKVGLPRKEIVRNNLREIEISWEGAKKKALNRLG